MNDEQGARFNKLLKVIGYIISAAVVWVYGSKWITALLIPEPEPGLWIPVGFIIVAGLAIISCIGVALYLWVKEG